METKQTHFQLDGMPGEDQAGSQGGQNPRQETHHTPLAGNPVRPPACMYQPSSVGGLQIGNVFIKIKAFKF